MSAISQLSHFPTGEDERELTVYRAITSILMQTINNETLAQEVMYTRSGGNMHSLRR